MSALKVLRRTFPHLRKVKDAKRGLNISVSAADSKSGRRKDPNGCALAHACVRQKIADAAVIGIGTSYLIKDNVAYRFKTSQAVAREITSFDRHQDFAAGRDYKLSAPAPTQTLDGQRKVNRSRAKKNARQVRYLKNHPEKRTHEAKNFQPKRIHRTEFIRSLK